MMIKTLDPRYQAVPMPRDTIFVHGQWVRSIGFETLTPEVDEG